MDLKWKVQKKIIIVPADTQDIVPDQTIAQKGGPPWKLDKAWTEQKLGGDARSRVSDNILQDLETHRGALETRSARSAYRGAFEMWSANGGAFEKNTNRALLQVNVYYGAQGFQVCTEKAQGSLVGTQQAQGSPDSTERLQGNGSPKEFTKGLRHGAYYRALAKEKLINREPLAVEPKTFW